MPGTISTRTTNRVTLVSRFFEALCLFIGIFPTSHVDALLLINNALVATSRQDDIWGLYWNTKRADVVGNEQYVFGLATYCLLQY